jgi:hypothetical protein
MPNLLETRPAKNPSPRTCNRRDCHAMRRHRERILPAGAFYFIACRRRDKEFPRARAPAEYS